jgi:glucose-6-phosphate-specific signal transduction histidine kinase
VHKLDLLEMHKLEQEEGGRELHLQFLAIATSHVVATSKFACHLCAFDDHALHSVLVMIVDQVVLIPILYVVLHWLSWIKVVVISNNS